MQEEDFSWSGAWLQELWVKPEEVNRVRSDVPLLMLGMTQKSWTTGCSHSWAKYQHRCAPHSRRAQPQTGSPMLLIRKLLTHTVNETGEGKMPMASFSGKRPHIIKPGYSQLGKEWAELKLPTLNVEKSNCGEWRGKRKGPRRYPSPLENRSEVLFSKGWNWVKSEAVREKCLKQLQTHSCKEKKKINKKRERTLARIWYSFYTQVH